jgi:hypothetical protein
MDHYRHSRYRLASRRQVPNNAGVCAYVTDASHSVRQEQSLATRRRTKSTAKAKKKTRLELWSCGKGSTDCYFQRASSDDDDDGRSEALVSTATYDVCLLVNVSNWLPYRFEVCIVSMVKLGPFVRPPPDIRLEFAVVNRGYLYRMHTL